MKRKLQVFGLLFAGALALAACAAPASTPMPDKPTAAAEDAMAKPTEAQMMEKPTITPQAMSKEMPTAEAATAEQTDASMMERPTVTPEAMTKETPTAEAVLAKPTEAQMMEKPTDAPGSMMKETPAWAAAPLTDVTTGKAFTISELKGKVVLVENMAIWCPTCLRQQREVKAMHALLGERADLVSVTLDIDPNEKAETLKAYVAKHGFDGLYAVAPAEMAREIGLQLGSQFLNPPAAPMFVIDRAGQPQPLLFGIKSAQALADALKPFLDEMK